VELSTSANERRAGSEIRVGEYVHYSGRVPDFEAGSPVSLPLYGEEQMAAAVVELREMLKADESPSCQAALATPFAEKLRGFAGAWFQRIDYPDQGLSSTSDHSLAYIDEGSFNTLARRLTSREACILRPHPKWRYLAPLFPPLAGKSVLEIGSSNGFFSFRFADAGAERVTGVEVFRRHCEIARWSAEVLKHDNVRFLTTDFLLDLSIESHDVVFLSEVHNHFLLPFLGLLRLVNLARETLILDTVTSPGPEHGIGLSAGWMPKPRQLIYHSFQLTDGMLLDFLNLVGVSPSKVTRYTAPDEPYHNVYVVDTRDVPATRARRNYPEYLHDVLALKFQGGPPGP
jgi:SAM-dependent methyltransferase